MRLGTADHLSFPCVTTAPITQHASHLHYWTPCRPASPPLGWLFNMSHDHTSTPARETLRDLKLPSYASALTGFHTCRPTLTSRTVDPQRQDPLFRVADSHTPLISSTEILSATLTDEEIAFAAAAGTSFGENHWQPRAGFAISLSCAAVLRLTPDIFCSRPQQAVMLVVVSRSRSWRRAATTTISRVSVSDLKLQGHCEASAPHGFHGQSFLLRIRAQLRLILRRLERRVSLALVRTTASGLTSADGTAAWPRMQRRYNISAQPVVSIIWSAVRSSRRHCFKGLAL
jgi:hypothetical protein